MDSAATSTQPLPANSSDYRGISVLPGDVVVGPSGRKRYLVVGLEHTGRTRANLVALSGGVRGSHPNPVDLAMLRVVDEPATFTGARAEKLAQCAMMTAMHYTSGGELTAKIKRLGRSLGVLDVVNTLRAKYC